MPIYAYKCDTCGFAKDVLQKLSDPLLKSCPSCGQATFSKQLTAAGFQLKGTGWYATDFRNNKAAPAAKATETDQAQAKPVAATSPTPTPSESSKPAAPATAGSAQAQHVG